MANIQVIIELQGAPGTEIRMTPPEIAAADPGKLIVRLEGRLAGLEALHAKTLTEIDRLTADADRARDDLAKPFAHPAEVAEARHRVQLIAAHLGRAAEPARPDPGQARAELPEWARDALRNPDDPRWLAAAAMNDAIAMTGMMGGVAVVTYSGPSESPAQAANLGFPPASPTTGTTELATQAAPGRHSRQPPTTSPRV
jgi:hypothetical protein